VWTTPFGRDFSLDHENLPTLKPGALKNLGVLTPGADYKIHAFGGYIDSNGKWAKSAEDWTETKQFTF